MGVRSGWGTRRVSGLVALGLIATLVTGCTGESTAAGARDGASATTTTPPAEPVALTANVADQAADVAPGAPITATAAGGTITEVALTSPEGTVVAGQLAADGLTWTNTEPLGYSKTYTLAVTGKNADGKTETTTSSFTTATPRTYTYLSINPLDGATVGVGQPLAFYFDESIADRAAAESMISITTSPAVEGAFYWYDEDEVHWRPQDFWAPGTTVTIDAKIYGKHVGNGIYGQEDRHVTATIGDSVIHEADGQTHQVVTKVNGQVTRTVPTSMGDAENPTPVGTYVITEKHDHMVMDSRTYGLSLEDGGYVTPVNWATRMSNSGIFVHGAPWSVGDQGHRNVSHGCLNMSEENAKFFYDNAKPGDVVIVTNSGGPRLESWDGFGDWQVPWEEWKAGNR
jgi:lipoprotein-anchoring transpeptidase ErfK/SrfK